MLQLVMVGGRNQILRGRKYRKPGPHAKINKQVVPEAIVRGVLDGSRHTPIIPLHRRNTKFFITPGVRFVPAGLPFIP